VNIKKLLSSIEEKFKNKLMAKTGWGRNEVIAAYKEAVSESLMEMINE